MTGLGATICCKCATDGIKLRDVEVELPLKEVPKPEVDLDQLMSYVDAYVEALQAERDYH